MHNSKKQDATPLVFFNDECNGVFLPRNSSVKEDYQLTAHAHSRVHTDVYKQNVRARITSKNTEEDIRRELNNIANELIAGTFQIRK